MKFDVCVFGGCSLDFMFYQNIDGTYNDVANLISPGGKGSNQAVAASRAGAKVAMISRLGKGEVGKKIIENLKFNNVDTTNVEVIDDVENDYSNIYINVKDKDNDIKRFGNAIDSFTTDMIENHKEVIDNSSIIVCQLKCPIEVTEKLIDYCYRSNKKIILTPCRPKKLIGRGDLIDKLTIITCNKKECETMFATDDIESCLKKYPNKLIVTLGEDGLKYYNGDRIVYMPAIKVEVKDTTGAGDTLNGNLAYLLSQGVDLKHALRKSMYASALKIQSKSAQSGMPYKDELEEYIYQSRNKDFTYKEELNFAIKLVKDAYFSIKTDITLNVDVKDDKSLVTNCDLEIEKYITTAIKNKYKNDNFLTEEEYSNNELEDRTWVIDPIDGTSHFVNGLDFWGIQLAFYDKGCTKFSIIYLPKVNKFFYAFENNGVYMNNHKILLSENKKELTHCIVEFCGSLGKELESKKHYFYKLISEKERIISNILHINSCCIAYTNLITGQTDALITSTKNPWDIMPGMFMCKEAGINIYSMDFEDKLTLLTTNENIKKLLFD